MSKQTDYLNKYIKEILLPVAQEDGFFLHKPKELIRINEPFIDIISFQLSQYGSRDFHIHYYKNLLSNPLLNIHAYTVGFRLSDNRANDDTDWCGAEEDQTKQAIESVLNAYNYTISPWFQNVNSVAHYIYEKASNPQTLSLSDFDSAIAFAEGGKRDKALWMFTKIVDSDIPDGVEDDTKEFLNQQKQACQKYLEVDEVESYSRMTGENTDRKLLDALSQFPAPATDIKNIDELLKVWKERNIEKFKLSKYFA